MKKEDRFSVSTEEGTQIFNVNSYLQMVKGKEKKQLHQDEIIFSLDAPLRKQCGCLLDSIPCSGCPDSGLMGESKSRDLEVALSILTPKQHYVLCNFFGLGGEEQTMKNIAGFLKVKTKKANSIKEKAINRLKSSDGAKNLLQCYLCS